MAEVVAPGSQAPDTHTTTTTTTTTTTIPSTQAQPPLQDVLHGRKRAADSALDHEQRLSKRFDLLNLEANNGARLYIPVAGSSDAAAPRSPKKQLEKAKPLAPVSEKKRKTRPRPPPADDCMQVEDTPNRVYIHDLAAELSDIESDEENPVFLSDIEKHLSKIPRHILVGPEPKPTKDNQLVLYNVPSSLTVPEERDNVRKAIVEARQRVRDRQANPTVEPARVIGNSANGMGFREISTAPEDPDAMDLD